ncbi:MAG: ATP-binding protein [Tepidisphaerales bacterium]
MFESLNVSPALSRREQGWWAPSTGQAWLDILIFFFCYYLAAIISLALSTGPQHVSAWWLPNSLLLAAVLLWPTGRIGFALAAGLAAQILAESAHGIPAGLSCTFYLANITQAIIAGGVLRLITRSGCFDTLRGTVAYIGVAAVAAPAIAAIPAAFMIRHADPVASFWTAWNNWRMYGMTTHIAATPLLLTLLTPAARFPRRITGKTFVEGGVLAASVLAVGLGVFRLSEHIISGFPPILYAPLAVLIWAATRFGPRGASAAIFTLSSVALWNTLTLHGPFASETLPPDILSLQYSLLFMALPALLVAALTLQGRQASAALADNRLRLQMILDNAPFGVHTYTLEPDGRLIFAGGNRSAERILNFENRQFVGKPLEEAFPALAGTDIPREYRRVATTGHPFMLDQFSYDAGGISGVFEVNAVQTAPNCVSVFFRDISERKKAEEQKAAVERQLLQAQKIDSLGNLAGGMAHDFNNLLTIIGGFAELAMMQIDPGLPPAAPLREVLTAVERARDLTRRILAFSRNQVLEVRVHNLNREIEIWRRLLTRLIGEHIEIVLRLEGNLANVRADAGQLQHVVFNLAVNARDAMPTGGKLTIETSNLSVPPANCGLPPSPCVLLSVSDTGTGMTPETLRHAFEPFFTTKPPGKGTGLGLATAFGIIKQHGGHMDVFSSPGNGATFRIYLPACDETETASSPRVSSLTEAVPNTTILVADDEAMVRELIRNILRDAGYRVIVATSASDALRIASDRSLEIHLLLTDMVMPEMNGRELHRRVYEMRPGLPAIFISGYVEADLAAYAGSVGDISILQKPFRIPALLEKVRAALSQS